MDWWAARRRSYVLIVAAAIPVSIIAQFLIVGLAEHRFPCFEVNGASVLLGLIFVWPGLLAARFCYRLGALSEAIVRPRQAMQFRQVVFAVGVAFSLLIVFSPPLLHLPGLFWPYTCKDKFGNMHVVR